jgi:hypothetical protein
MENILHIYSQVDWHDEAYIVGNPAGLKALRDAIDEALSDRVGTADAYVNDGEGFRTIIINHDKPYASEDWNKVLVPYCGGKEILGAVPQGAHPYELMSEQDKDKYDTEVRPFKANV